MLPVVLAGATACRENDPAPTIAHVWEVWGTTLSVAAWADDSLALRAAAERVRDRVRLADSVSQQALRHAWAEERGDVRLEPEWDDVAGGYALDRAIPALAAVADSALLDLGGLFFWLGPDTRRGVGIADPDNSLDAVAQVELRGGSLHTVAADHRSVTVLAPGAFQAAAWASALFPLGCDRALALAPDLERRQVRLVCIDSTGVRWTPNLEVRVREP